ncbi:tyrosine-type recombinase/integrase [Haloechinothrix sp. YIM 98757]|uniref:Tyrosine-type recombinase/integrase n=1 Tax=Haloechinothrix aidingensis TaxID=2752311 RepID=A0A838ADR9_9PSEU|nr:tyrosine-type recombinase/integrase [Haloechinothrix aidingensis]MBA0127370.1 tyrosine-type recombinase/integrase [Haloechinothrix aidingensis]
MSTSQEPQTRQRGEIVRLPSGSLRVKVYAGIDPVTKKRHYRTEVVPPASDPAKQRKQAEKVRTRLLSEVDENRQVRTSATVGQLLDEHVQYLSVEENTLAGYRSLIEHHVRPLLGDERLGRVDAKVLDSFYSELRRCRAHCRGGRYTEHRTDREHECDDRCRPHQCRSLGNGSIRKVRAILSGAGKRALRWGWVGVNPFDMAEPLPAARPDPQPPSPDQAATIVNEAWADLDWGMLVWLAMVSGARRGELCALTWKCLDSDTGVLTIRSSIAQKGRKTWEKETKTHQQRRITLDEQTVALLKAYRQHCAERAGIGTEMPGEARIFSTDPVGRSWLKPDTVSQRYARMCSRIGWDMNIHQLRHYSATELIASGVDVRTVAGRLGHGGGGATTLRVYSAWVAEADQRAAGSLAGRMPELPVDLAGTNSFSVSQGNEASGGESPYQKIAADLKGSIACGVLNPGDALPTVAKLAERYRVSAGTAQRAIAALRAEGLATVSRGRRATVADPAVSVDAAPAEVVSLRNKRTAT